VRPRKVAVRNIRAGAGYAQPPHLFLNQGDGMFQDVALQAGPEFARAKVGRGLACGDFDRDGDVDILMTTNNGPRFSFGTTNFPETIASGFILPARNPIATASDRLSGSLVREFGSHAW
jgi:hypothetical protein